MPYYAFSSRKMLLSTWNDLIWILFSFLHRSLWFIKVSQSRNDFFKLTFHPKNEHTFDFTTMIPQVDMFLFIFRKKLKTPKRHFKINWPSLHTHNQIHLLAQKFSKFLNKQGFALGPSIKDAPLIPISLTTTLALNSMN